MDPLRAVRAVFSDTEVLAMRIPHSLLLALLLLAPTGALVAQEEAPPEPTRSWTDDFKVGAWAELWIVPILEAEDPHWRDHDTFFLRFARASVTYRPNEAFRAKIGIGVEVTPNPLVDVELSWTGWQWLNVTAGQFRLPVTRTISTGAKGMDFLDRPTFARSMAKARLRDIGVMLHTGQGGLWGGLLEGSFGVFNGNGALGGAAPELERSLGGLLYTGRLVVEPGHLLHPDLRLALGASYAGSVDPAIDTGDAAADRRQARWFLGGRLTPFGESRYTQLVGGDLLFRFQGLKLVSDVVWLDSAASESDASREAFGFNVDLTYRVELEDVALIPAARLEHFNRDLDADDAEIWGGELGGNVEVGQARFSAFGGLSRYETIDGEQTSWRLQMAAQVGI